jgi:hypothetical protein
MTRSLLSFSLFLSLFYPYLKSAIVPLLGLNWRLLSMARPAAVYLCLFCLDRGHLSDELRFSRSCDRWCFVFLLT